MSAEPQLDLFAACPPGVEPFLAQEMAERELGNAGIPEFHIGEGGIAFSGTMHDLFRANLWLRTATRVSLRLGSFYATKFVELRRKAGNLPWEQFLDPAKPISIRASCKQSKLYHSGAVSERVIGAIGDRLGSPPKVDVFDEDQPAGQLILVRFNHDQCTISLDTSGQGLYKRGYRLEVGRAPLRETLAAAILIASGWDRNAPLLDPFCGSGVIPIEAAMMANRIAPGIHREFAFMKWRDYDQQAFESERQTAISQKQSSSVIILGSDRDAGAVRTARENAERATVTQWVQFTQAAVSAIQPPPGPGWVVTNPPYGLRISASNDLRNLYSQFGKVLRARCPGWHTAFLCNDDHLASLTRFHFVKGVSLNNGGIPVKLSLGKVPLP